MQKGFTLIELMIVVAIIGILGAIIYPAITGGNKVVGSRDFSATSGTVVNETKCVNGLVLKNGDVVIENGNAVKC